MQGYTSGPATCPDLMAPAAVTYSRYLTRHGAWQDARGIHQWGGLDTFDPYVLH